MKKIKTPADICIEVGGFALKSPWLHTTKGTKGTIIWINFEVPSKLVKFVLRQDFIITNTINYRFLFELDIILSAFDVKCRRKNSNTDNRSIHSNLTDHDVIFISN
ncbi:hypothetical protein ACKWTF_016051 [Chironomus riparius]